MVVLRWVVRAVVLAGAAVLLGSCDFTPPLVLHVTTTVDGSDAAAGDGVCEMTAGAGDCSLRAAVDEANAATDGLVTVTVPAGTYVLTQVGDDDTNQGGDLDIARAGGLVFGVEADDRVAIDADGAGGVIDVHAGNVVVGGAGIAGASDAGVRVADGSTVSLVHGASTANGGAGATVAAGGRLVLLNTTVSSNGGAGVVVDGALEATHVTIAANGGGGIAGSGTSTLRASVVGTQAGGSDCAGAVPTSLGDNLDSDGTCALAGPRDAPATPPRLGPLTATAAPFHPLRFGSAAIDATAPGVGACPAPGGLSIDQVGTARPQGGGCDRGAIESIGGNDLVVSVATDARDAVAGDGVCEATAGTGDCTLRAAIDEVNAAGPGPGRTITLAVDPQVTIAGPGEGANATGDLDLLGDVVVEGGGHVVTAAGNGDRVVEQLSGTAELRDLTVTGGKANTGGDPVGGGGILVAATMILREVTVTGNLAYNYPGLGPGISNGSGIGATATSQLTVLDSRIIANRDPFAFPTGLRTDGIVTAGDLVVERTVISDNGGATAALYRGGVEVRAGGHARIDSSAITDHMRALLVDEGGVAVVSRSTIGATEVGIRVEGALEVVSSTVVTTGLAIDNQRLSPIGPTVPSVEVTGSVLAVAAGPACVQPVTSHGWNVGPPGVCGFDGPGDREVTDSRLLPLGDDGGPTATHQPHADSPAVDAIPIGTPGLCDGSGLAAQDQRGVVRPSGAACDAGAVEGSGAATSGAGAFVVDVATDEPDLVAGDGVCTTATGGCTLRAAVQESNANGADDSITIAPGVGTIELSLAEADPGATDLDVTGSLTIEGNGAVIDANGLGRVIHQQAGLLVLRDLTITGGRAPTTGGGVLITTAAVLERADVIANVVEVPATGTRPTGAGIAGPAGSLLSLVDSRVSANRWTYVSGTRGESGAGIATAGSLRLVRSVVMDNGTQATFGDSQVDALGPAAVVESTIDGSTLGGRTQSALRLSGRGLIERSTVGGGRYGLRLDGYTVEVIGSTLHATEQAIALPTNGTYVALRGSIIQSAGIACANHVYSFGWNVYSDNTCTQQSTDRAATDPLLGPLADNGGPTPTRLPGAGSWALDRIPAGTPLLCDGTYPTDQRGTARPTGAGCDLGSVEQ